MARSAVKRGAGYGQLQQQQGWSPDGCTEPTKDTDKTSAAWGVFEEI